MPYETNADLPEAVKNALPAAAQNIWRNAFNSAAEQHPGDEQRASQIAWGAVKNAGWQKDADGNWMKKNAASHEFDIEVMSTGTWGGDEFTAAHLDEMVKNSQALKDIIKAPVKFGHENRRHIADGQPAVGWVKALKRAGDKLVATVTDVPDIIFKAIQKKLYRRVSAEVYFNFKHARNTYGRVLSAVGLLGADIPEVKNLQDLTAFLSQSTPDAGGSFERAAAYSFATDDSGHHIIADKKGDDEMEKDELQKKLDAEKALRIEAEADAKKYKEQAEAEAQTRAAELKTSRTEDLRAFCEDQVKAGRMTPAGRDIITNAIDRHVYSEKDGFAIGLETFKQYAAAQPKALDTTEKAGDSHKQKDGDYESANAEVDARARKYMAEHKADYAEAVKTVLLADDELAARYFEEDPVTKDKEVD